MSLAWVLELEMQIIQAELLSGPEVNRWVKNKGKVKADNCVSLVGLPEKEAHVFFLEYILECGFSTEVILLIQHVYLPNRRFWWDINTDYFSLVDSSVFVVGKE